MIRTLKENCERIKTQYGLERKDFKPYDVLPQLLEEYNFNTIHHTIEMTPVDARKPENKITVESRNKKIYNTYNPENKSLLSVGDKFRMSNYKKIFD